MPVFLDTHGNSVLSIAICDRCRMKRAYVALSPDPNFPGLRVCDTGGCKDEFDPYRLPARQPEKIAIRFPRPDAPVPSDPHALESQAYSDAEISLEQNLGDGPVNGNLDTLAP